MGITLLTLAHFQAGGKESLLNDLLKYLIIITAIGFIATLSQNKT